MNAKEAGQMFEEIQAKKLTDICLEVLKSPHNIALIGRCEKLLSERLDELERRAATAKESNGSQKA